MKSSVFFLIALFTQAAIGHAAELPVGEVRAAFAAAEAGPHRHYVEAERLLAGHPLLAWLQAAHLDRDRERLRAEDLAAFLDRWPRSPAAAWLRQRWLASHLDDAAGQRRFGAATGAPDLVCAWLWATRDQADTDWRSAFARIWRSANSLPDNCDRVITFATGKGWLDEPLRWQRILIAADHGRTGLMRHLGDQLPAADRERVQQFAAFITRPSEAAAHWPIDARAQAIVVAGLERLARRDPDRAESLRALLAPTLQLDADADRRLRYAIALWAAADYADNAGERIAAVPAEAIDTRLRQWQVRVALARGDDAGALAAIAALPAPIAEDSRWTYLAARLHERNGEFDTARAEYETAARASDFHGFLAADRIDAPYALCPRTPPADAAAQAQLDAEPGLARALDLFAIGRSEWAQREWRALMPKLSPAARVEAVRRARAIGWHDRILFDLPADADGRRLYRLRFPLPYRRQVEAAGRRFELDPAWIAAQIRAESVWMRDARSHANALGLMQLLPGTARPLARRLDIPWQGEATLFQGSRNIVLGSAHLRAMLDAYDGKPYLAIAAYNAGRTAVRDWMQARGTLPADLWIETIPYAETRDYVARVLAFSVIYDWRLQRPARPVSERMLGRPDRTGGQHRAFVCSTAQAAQGS